MRIRTLFALPLVLIRHRELLWSFIWRDLKARYQGSLLGRLWPILNPLILFGLYYLVFAVIIGARLESRGLVDRPPTPEEAERAKHLMGLYIISGVLPWIGLSEGVTRATGVVLENGNLVKKIAFPSQLLPVYAVAVNLIYMLIGLLLFVVVSIFFLPDGLPSHWPVLLVAIPLQFVFTVGLGLVLGAMNIFIRDTSQIIGLILQLWFFATPIVYPASLITKALGDRDWIMKWNPAFHLMELYRCALVPTYVDQPGVDPWFSMGALGAMALVTFLPAYAFFLSTKGRFADEL